MLENASRGSTGAFAEPVSASMTALVHTIRHGDSVIEAERRMAEYGFSALPVVDEMGRLAGVLSRTDLLRAGRVRHGDKVLSLPNNPVAKLMHATVEVVAPDTSLSEAARRMLRQRIHRLFVVEDSLLLGVVSTKEMVRAVAKARVRTPIAELMHQAPVIVQASDALSFAIDRMGSAHATGLVVIEEGWPVGMFTQENALAARDAPPEHHVDEWMDAHVISLPMAMPAHRAAEQALATRCRRVLVVDAQGVRGIVSGMDFARLVAS